ncbi:MAG: Cache 3/Cache 2 fusion domain-containing protein [Candidatus Bathyarchaeota archaeon]|nr:Cache 3/Cache 2 fusion domain-containing protein [Candidatus Bathyarchaeota archaeon]
MKKFGDISIKWQFLAVCVILVTVPVLGLTVITNDSVQNETLSQIENNLQNQALDLQMLVESTHSEIQANEEYTDEQAKAITSSQTEAIYKFITSYQGDEEALKSTIASIDVGETGYVFVIDYSGTYIVSKDRQRDGENIYSETDSDGNFFVREMLQKAMSLSGNQIDYHYYEWKNVGDSVSRTKIAALVHIPAKEWVVGVSVYFDELVDATFAETKLNALKDRLAEIVIGKTGYICILDEEGEYVLSYNRERDGENLWNTKDAEGNYFIQEIVNKGLDLSEGETDITYYPWQNSGESVSRMKVAAFSSFPAWDWVIVATAYQDDFLDGLKQLTQINIIVAAVAIAAGSGISFVFTRAMTKNFDKLAKQMNEVAQGDLTGTVDTTKVGKNEIGKMTSSLAVMVQNLKGLITSLQTAGHSLTSMSQEIGATAQEVNAGMEQVSSATQQISQGAQQLATLSQNAANNVNTLSAVFQETGANAERSVQIGLESMEVMQQIQEESKKAVEAIDHIRGAMDNTAITVEGMDTALEKIGELANVVTNVASKTEMLALNAAIEAGRAGEAGRGFAVVADAVKNLSDQSNQAANETLHSVTQVQSKGKEALEVAKNSSLQGNEGVQTVRTSIEGTGKVADSVEQITALLKEVSDGVKKGIEAVDAVVKAVDEVSSISEEAASASEENSSAVEEQTASMNQLAANATKLSEVAVELQKELEKFKL